MVKNLPAMEQTQVQSLGQEDPLEMGMATHSSILAWRIPWTEDTVHGVAKSGRGLSDFHFTSWTVAHQAPLSLGFPRQEHWSG